MAQAGKENMENSVKISFGGGCFWGVEHAFKQLEGVLSTQVGYQGGKGQNPTYVEVCSKTTGHAEVVRVQYNPEVLSLTRLLDAFFFMHDATQENRQGPDIGSQYRSCIFVDDQATKDKVNQYLESHHSKIIERGLGKTLTTEVAINKDFYMAEENHQDYLVNNPTGYCHIGFDVFQKIKMGQF